MAWFFIIDALIIIIIVIELEFLLPLLKIWTIQSTVRETHDRFVGTSVNRGSIRDCGHRDDGSFDVGFGITESSFGNEVIQIFDTN